jgi:hypothetical protein
LPGRNTSTDQFAIGHADFPDYGRPRFRGFVREVIAKRAYFGAGGEAERVTDEICVFFENYQGVAEPDRNSTFYLGIYTEAAIKK